MPKAFNSTHTSHLDALTGLRAYAAILVVLFHLSLNGFYLNAPNLVQPGQFLLSNAGWFGVSFFFVLSGFVLTWSLRTNDSAGQFMWRRAARIVPLHFFTFMIALAIAGLAGASSWEATANLFLLHAWVPRDSAFFSVNHPSWSLSAEMFFYGMFPVLIPTILRMHKRLLLPTAAGLIGLALILPVLARQLPMGEVFGPNHSQSPLYGSSIGQVWAVYAFPVVRLFEFILGMVCARLVQTQAIPHMSLRVATVAVIVGYAVSLYVPTLWQMSAIYGLPVALLITAAAQSSTPPRAIAGPLAKRLGEISFALYMVHDLVLMAVGKLFGPLALPIVPAGFAVSLVLGLSISFAWLVWKFIETPANAFLRSLSLSSFQKLES